MSIIKYDEFINERSNEKPTVYRVSGYHDNEFGEPEAVQADIEAENEKEAEQKTTDDYGFYDIVNVSEISINEDNKIIDDLFDKYRRKQDNPDIDNVNGEDIRNKKMTGSEFLDGNGIEDKVIHTRRKMGGDIEVKLSELLDDYADHLNLNS